MIGYLKGHIIDVSDGRVLLAIEAGDSSVGYSVQVVQGPLSPELVAGQRAELFIHTHVREDALDLYGFSTRVERELFLVLLGVNGIGPKGAMGVLCRVDPMTLIRAVQEADKDSLTELPGIGKKTAERMVLELSDPIKKRIESGKLPDPRAASQARAARPATGKSGSALPAGPALSAYSTMMRDAKSALVGLGYREQDVTSLLSRLLEHSDAAPARVEDLVRTALQQLAQ